MSGPTASHDFAPGLREQENGDGRDRGPVRLSENSAQMW